MWAVSAGACSITVSRYGGRTRPEDLTPQLQGFSWHIVLIYTSLRVSEVHNLWHTSEKLQDELWCLFLGVNDLHAAVALRMTSRVWWSCNLSIQLIGSCNENSRQQDRLQGRGNEIKVLLVQDHILYFHYSNLCHFAIKSTNIKRITSQLNKTTTISCLQEMLRSELHFSLSHKRCFLISDTNRTLFDYTRQTDKLKTQ